jgi:hypothetical protein
VNKAAVIVGAVVICLQGCSGFSVKQEANVTSNPSDASVYADGVELGRTPLLHNLYEAFPASWSGTSYGARGLLTVKKEGCDDYSLKISDYILSEPIHAELKCGEQLQEESASTVENIDEETEKRLEELESLHKKGIISEDEYKSTRKRILSEI